MWMLIWSRTTVKKALHDFMIPKTPSKLCLYIILRRVFRRLMPNFPPFACSLVARLGKSLTRETGQLNEDISTVLMNSQEKFITLPRPAISNKEGRYNIESVVFDWQIMCLLLKKQNSNVDKTVGYRSKILNKSEQDWVTLTNNSWLLFGKSFVYVHTWKLSN